MASLKIENVYNWHSSEKVLPIPENCLTDTYGFKNFKIINLIWKSWEQIKTNLVFWSVLSSLDLSAIKISRICWSHLLMSALSRSLERTCATRFKQIVQGFMTLTNHLCLKTALNYQQLKFTSAFVFGLKVLWFKSQFKLIFERFWLLSTNIWLEMSSVSSVKD